MLIQLLKALASHLLKRDGRITPRINCLQASNQGLSATALLILHQEGRQACCLAVEFGNVGMPLQLAGPEGRKFTQRQIPL